MKRASFLRFFAMLFVVICLCQGGRSEATGGDASSALMAIQEARFAEPLVRTKPTNEAEDVALAEALRKYQGRSQVDDFSALTDFLSTHPNSGWKPALQTNLGAAYLHNGYFSKALSAWEGAWASGKDSADPRVKLIVDRAIGDLARLYTAFGQFDKVELLFEQIGQRPIAGSATEAIQQARDQLTLVTKDPRHLFNCGPVALKALILAVNKNDKRADFLRWYRAGPSGTSLAELAGLAEKAGFSYKIVSRLPGMAVPIPALIHWKVGHFSTVVAVSNGRYQVEDLSFAGGRYWVTRAAIDSEASGYFLIPSAALGRSGLQLVDASAATHIQGKGPSSGIPPGDYDDKPTRPPGGCAMCDYTIKEAVVGLSLNDRPVGYTPPIGPAPKVTITYNQREDSQPAVFTFYNVSPKWTLDWLTYVIDDPTNPGATVSRFLSGGGAYYYSGYSSGTGQFARQSGDGSILVLASQGPVTYRRQLGDGSVEIYAHSDGSTSYPRKVFLSQVIDPQGNALTLTYDGSDRLTTLTDATGRQTTFAYNESDPLLVSEITDPFGRSAKFSYDGSGRLSSITDILGLQSTFTYDANSLVDSMTTPYGTTNFAYTPPGSPLIPRYVEVTDPLGYAERVEWKEPTSTPSSEPSGDVPVGMPVAPTNNYLKYRNSLYWNKDAYLAASCTPSGGCDETKARITHFAHVAGTSMKSTTIESIKSPLQNRVWYNYPGQTSSIDTGSASLPSAVGRVLDDGTTQLSRASYDLAGFFKPTQIVDPVGRITNYTYSNQIDLAAVSQTTEYGMQTTIAQYTYNARHRPILATNAAGQTTRLSYNATGQVTSVTDALGNTTSFSYDPVTLNLTSVTNANSVTAAAYTYDAFNRIATFTDSQGWSVAYTYDAADRVTKVSYPDGTAETFTYDKLDLASSRDRLGRVWKFTYSANRELTAMTDWAGDQTLFGHNRIGQVTSRTDPKGYVTTWDYDIEGRPTLKTFDDTSTVTLAYENTISRLKTVTDDLGQIKELSYAKDHAPLNITYANEVNPTPDVSFTWDSYYPRITSMTDGTGTTQYSYVPVGSPGALGVYQESTPIPDGTITYAYDALGRTISRTVAGSGAETFEYDPLGRTTVHENDLGSFEFTYLGQTGQVTQRELAGSTIETNWSYLPNSGDRRLASVGSVGLTSGDFTTFDYVSKSDGMIGEVTQTSDLSTPYPGTMSQSATYNNLNQLTNLAGQAYTYDANGNLLSDGTRDFSWDAENRLVEITYPGQPGKSTAFAYDGLGRRFSIARTPPGGGSTTTTSYIWCGIELCQARDAGGAVVRAYYGEGEFEPGTPSTSYYYGMDQLGSVRRVYTTGQAPSFDYDPYGNALQATSPLTDFNYAGMVTEPDSGLYLATFRAYDPVTGRFLSRDPLGESTDLWGNLYGYASGNPINATDPSGLFPAAIIPWIPRILPLIPVVACWIWCPAWDPPPPAPSPNPIPDGRRPPPSIPQPPQPNGPPDCYQPGPWKPSPPPPGPRPDSNPWPEEARPSPPPPVVPPYLPQEKTPNMGPPGGRHINPGSDQERWYGSDGKPIKDIDRDHPHPGVTTPHVHDWTPSPSGGFPSRNKPRDFDPEKDVWNGP